MARYILDISKAKLDFLRDGDPLSLPCEDGVYYTDIDIIEEELPEDFVKKMRDCCLLKMHSKTAREHWEEMESMPVGFDIAPALKAGARLIKVGDE
jgi:hypothetical protein